MKQIYRILGLMIFLFALSCNLDEDLDNPNELSVDEANPDLLMNQVQLELSDFFSRISGNDRSAPASGVSATAGVDQLIRMNAMSGGDTYDRAIVPQNMDEIWNKAYQGILINVEALIPLAEEKGLMVHVGAAKILKAYVYLTLVDVFGDVPFSEALKGDELVFNPKVDSGKSIYEAVIALLDEAKEDLAADSKGDLTRDIYYNGDPELWTTLANTLQFKAWLNVSASADQTLRAKAITELNALILDGDLIDTDEEEFTYKYGTANVPVRSRHPYYRQYYRPQAGAASGHIGNYYMHEVYNGLGVQDPRWRYYFFRQVGSIAKALDVDGESVPCVLSPIPPTYAEVGAVFCVFEPGFYGRDHGNADGGPPDNNVITCPGAYPAGGLVDTNDGDPEFQKDAQQGQGGNGAGIEPLFMSWFTDFMMAEAILRLGIAGDAKAYMLSGIEKSINRVRSFSNNLGQSLPEGLEPSSVAYRIAVETKYDNAPAHVDGTSLEGDKLDVAMTEFYKSLYGNGVEAYNMYRRTSSPKNIQPVRASNPGKFYRSLVYPAVFVNLNNSTSQKTENDVRVFWDGNPDVLK